MFITCQECNTTFRLDEHLLKPTGSKVRCSQCRYTFIAAPSSPKPVRKQAAMTPVFEALTDESPAPAVNEETQDLGLEGIDLAELDSILEGEAASAGPEAKQVGRAVADAGVASGDDVDDLDEIDLDFDFDAALEAEGNEEVAPSPSVATDESSDELSLEMDFEIDDDTLVVKKEEVDGLDLAALTVEEEPVKATGKSVSVSEPSLEDDLDLAFKDLDLGAEEKPVKTPEAPKGKHKMGDDLDLDDLDFDLMEESKADRPEREEMELSLADESEPSMEKPALGKSAAPSSKAADKAPKEDSGLGLELDLGELGLDSTPKGPAISPIDAKRKSKDDLDLDLDLDMSDALEMETSPKKAVAEEKDELSLDLEPDFDLESAAEATAKPAAADAGEEDLEELDFELDTEFDEKPAAKAPKDAVAVAGDVQDDGIDLSDIEQMLEGDAGAAKKVKPAVIPQETMGLGGAGEIDLTEFESAIDNAGEAAEKGPEMLEEPELELELDTVAPEAAAKKPAMDIADRKAKSFDEPLDLDLELELESEAPANKAGKAVETDRADSELDLSDLSDLGGLTDEKAKTTKTETVHSGDIELEFQIEEDQGPAVSSRATVGRTAGRIADVPVEQTVETLAVEPKVAKRPKPIKPKKKSGKAWVVLLLILLLAALGAGVYYAVMYMNIQIPYVSDYLKPKPKDPAGILSLTTMDINSKFIENSQSGRLFVITGKVRNGYSMRRNTIRLQGKLFTKGKVLVKTEFSYAGVVINDQELSALSIAEIKQLLNAAPPLLDATGNVQPGQNLPFMVVFSDLPAAEQLDEFAVELVSSLPGQ